MGTTRFAPPLEAARQSTKMIGQTVALEQIQQAIFAQDKRFKVVLVHAQGGMGKTRLLEEVGIKVSREWAALGNTAVSQLIDVIDIRLHDRNRFIRELRNAYPRPFEFREYENAQDEVILLRASGAQLNEMQKAEQTAIDAFLQDLAEITRRHRVVWIIDTVEQLSYITSEWLIDNELLRPTDLEDRTHQWLKELIQNQHLQNITLILAGRGVEGQSFFTSIKDAIKNTNGTSHPRELIDINLVSLTPAQTRTYFQQLAQDWQTVKNPHVDQVTSQRIAQQFQSVASEKDRADVLWLYTAGIPVRLALYAQIIIEGREIPKPLRYTFAQAVKEAGTDDPYHSTPALLQLQWTVEDQFINLLFRNPTDLRSRVLQALVRAPRGLSAEQLHFILDNKDNLTPAEWQNDLKRVKEIAEVLHNMQNYYLVKSRSSWTDIAKLRRPEEQTAATFRLGLQDEIYRIYAEHMAPHTEPRQPEVTMVWNALNDDEKNRYRDNHAFEKQERQKQYVQLSFWAKYQHQIYLNEKQEIMAADERQLELSLVPDRPRTFYFEQLGTTEIAQRLAINEAITTFEIEALVYQLLQDPEKNLNENYIDIGTSSSKANQGDFDFWAQLEMWRITHDRYSLKFTDFTERHEAVDHGETMIDVLHRAVTQEDVSRWIKRFILRDNYVRGLDLADQVELLIQALPKETRLEKRIWYSWNHSLIYAERRIWACYGRIYLSQDMSNTLAELHHHIRQLERLVDHTVQESAITRTDGHVERGFKGVPEENIPDHPAYVRVRRLLSLAYNILGYGYATLGQVRNAVKYYGRSLYHIRGDKGVDSHRGYVLNDLAKALSDMGRNSITICLDGLKLRRNLAEEVPLAVSYNTLALIYDDMDRYEDAPELAAKAIAYLRRAGAERWLAMALQQLGESLRHLAIRTQRGEKVQATSDSLYAASETLLREAKRVFVKTGEVSRLIMVLIELGSLYRDRLRPTTDQTVIPTRQRENDYREAILNLSEAMTMAHEKQLIHLEVDAGVNLAWTHFHAGNYAETEKVIQKLGHLVPEPYLITQTSKPDINDESLKDIFWVLRQFSKTHMIRGQSALAQFKERSRAIARTFPTEKDADKRHTAIRHDDEAMGYLNLAAENYTLAVGYAYILSPNGRTANFLLDDLYDQLKAFNHLELDGFYSSVLIQADKYEHLESRRVLSKFLQEFFGVFGQEEEKVTEA